MENCDIEEPWWLVFMDTEEDPYAEEEQEKKPMTRESLKISGAFRSGVHNNKWLFELSDSNGLVVAEVFNTSKETAYKTALEMAAAPVMVDDIELLWRGESWPARPNSLADAKGTVCEACDELGQPSRMAFSPSGRAYHPECLPEKVKAEIAAKAKAADTDGADVPF